MLKKFIIIREQLQNPNISANEIKGDLIFNENFRPILTNLVDNDCIENLIKTKNGFKRIEELSEGDLVNISLFPLKLKNSYYFEQFEDLLKTFSQKYPTSEFYIHSLGYNSNDENIPEQVISYKSLLTFIDCLVLCADYRNEFTSYNELIFLLKDKIIIETKYNIENLKLLINADALYNQLTDTNDKIERKNIFTTELISYIEHIQNSTERFTQLIDQFNGLYNNYLKSHKFYLEQFSFQKIKTEFDEKKIDYAKKIREVLSSTQSKLIAVPIAFLLIASQFDLDGLLFGRNLSLVLSSIIFSVLLTLLINSQKNELYIVSKDLLKFEADFLKKIELIKINDFNESVDDLKENTRKQERRLNFILIMIWLVSILSIVLFVIAVYTHRPDWITDLYHKIDWKKQWLTSVIPN